MHYFYVPQLTPKHEFVMLPEDEARHATKALRMRIGDEILLLDGNGGKYTGAIYGMESKRCEVRIDKYELQAKPYPQHIHIAVSPTKNTDRMEWMIEKMVEIGVGQISFVISRYCERKSMKMERLHKIAVAAMKQSGNFYLPKMSDMILLKDFLAKVEVPARYMAYVPTDIEQTLAKAFKPESSCVLIGPEGGFGEEEVALATDAGFVCVSLSHNRLRTETAGIVAAHTLGLLFGMG